MRLGGILYVMAVSKRVRAQLFLACSVGAMVGVSGAARAQCVPDPTITAGTTVCSGVDRNGLIVSTNSSVVDVPVGGIVSNGNGPAIAVSITAGAGEISRKSTISVGGTVDGVGNAGIAVDTGPLQNSVYGAVPNYVSVNVAEGGLVTGATGISIAPLAANRYGYASVSLDNAGTIWGTSGLALLATAGSSTSFAVTNRSTGVIGGMSGAFSKIENEGSIDGGTGSAINGTENSTWLINSGKITSSGSSATVAGKSKTIVNSGTISNLGSGAAISGGVIDVTNEEGGLISAATGPAITTSSLITLKNSGTISTGGTGPAVDGWSVTISNSAGGTILSNGTAINSSISLNMRNEGEIVGDVYAGRDNTFTGSASYVDSTAGSMKGNLIFGGGDDLLYAVYTDDGGFSTGVTGLIDGGAGTNTLMTRFLADATVSSALVLPKNFQKFEFITAADSTVTLDQGFSAPGTIQASGQGSIVNRADITGTGTILSAALSDNGGFTNSGTISATGLSGDYAVKFVAGASFDNRGTISAVSDALAVNATSFSNSGTIRSTDGTALKLDSYSYNFGEQTARNTGSIEGGRVGVSLNGALINDGDIASAGQAVAIGSYGKFYNRADGVVTGGSLAIGGMPGSSVSSATIINAGTINGDVSLGSSTGTWFTNNRFFIEDGGLLNGNLSLGYGDTLVLGLGEGASGQFAGINGSVTGNGSNLRYVVKADAQASVAPITGFNSIGFDLYDGATLTLTGAKAIDQQLTFAGAGSAVLNADFNVGTGPAITTSYVLDAYSTSYDPSAASIVSNGDITLTRAETASYFGAAVQIGSEDSFTNNGVITVSDPLGLSRGSLAAISGGTIVNAGTISVDGGTGVSNAVSLTNSGTVTATGAAVMLASQSSVVNSGTLESTGAAAIGASYSYGTTIENLAGGTIAGKGTAIRLEGATVINAGTIKGNVDLASASYGISWQDSAYVAAGGTLEGNLLFGQGNDALIETGSGFGVTGTIDGGGGFDYIGHERAQDATVKLGAALPDSFEGEFVVSRGGQTTVTIDAEADLDGDILLAGDGKFVNHAATSGRITGLGDTGLSISYLEDLQLVSLTNTADAAGGIGLGVASLINSGAVGSADLSSRALDQRATGEISFDNSGNIRSSGWDYTAWVSGDDLTSAHISNSGIIDGSGFVVSLSFAENASASSGTFTNSGTITGKVGAVISVSETSDESAARGLFKIVNSGTIEATASGGRALETSSPKGEAFSITNSGTIRANGGGSLFENLYFDPGCTNYFNPFECYGTVYETVPAVAIDSYGIVYSGENGESLQNPVSTTITNEASGLIEASGGLSTAIRSHGPLTLVNLGTIVGTDGYVVDASDLSLKYFGTTEFAGAVQTFGDAADSIVNSGAIIGSIALGGGNDTIVNTGSIIGDVYFGAGDDRFVQGISAKLGGTVYGGEGNDTAIVDLTGGGVLDSSFFASFSGFENFGVTGSGSVSVNGILPVQTLLVDTGATFELQAGSTLQTLGKVALTGTGGSERIINRGSIVGDVMLGSGDDVFEAYAGSSVTGVVDAGAGVDRLAFHLGETSNTPTAIDLATYTGFEQLAMESGIGSLAGRADFDSIWVNGGRLIGLAGSTINAATGITVARGATFGSAGTVNGDIVVHGTLSPGASPGTLTVNGNVALAAESTTLFEMTPTLSDALVIGGTLTIANGSTLQIVGERPLTPGVTYHLISTTGGITGTFSTIDKAQTVLGYIVQTADSLDLLSTLQVRSGAGRPVSAAMAYINDLLIGGNASAQMIAALPQLTDADGYVDARLAGTLHPEAYAAASQIGIDNGLAISSALRSAQRIGADDRSSFFMLGQGLGSWQNLRASAARGTARVNQSSGGFLGGIGYRAGEFAVSAFAGRIYTNQSIATLGAKTKADGTFAGAAAAFTRGGFDIGGAVIWDGSSAKTSRALFDGTTAVGHYDLHSLTFDAHGGYGFALGKGGWRLGPELGVTHIRVKRGQTQESGNAVFALDVESRKQDATFLSADVRLDMASSERLRPWLTAGWRRRISGDTTLATAGFTGVSGQFSVFGAERDRDYAQVGGGFDWTVTPGITLFARGSSTFAGANGVTNVNGGVRLGF